MSASLDGHSLQIARVSAKVYHHCLSERSRTSEPQHSRPSLSGRAFIVVCTNSTGETSVNGNALEIQLLTWAIFQKTKLYVCLITSVGCIIWQLILHRGLSTCSSGQYLSRNCSILSDKRLVTMISHRRSPFRTRKHESIMLEKTDDVFPFLKG